MAFSITPAPGTSLVPIKLGNLRASAVDINITSYTNPGGETLVPASFGMNRILGVIPIACPFGFVVNFTRATNKVTIARDNSAATAAALPEVTNANAFGALSLLVIGL